MSNMVTLKAIFIDWTYFMVHYPTPINKGYITLLKILVYIFVSINK
jgi:uncharacterized membrane protein